MTSMRFFEKEAKRYKTLYVVTSAVLGIVLTILLSIAFCSLFRHSNIDRRSEEYKSAIKIAEEVWQESKSLIFSEDTITITRDGIEYEVTVDSVSFVLDEYDSKLSGILVDDSLQFSVESNTPNKVTYLSLILSVLIVLIAILIMLNCTIRRPYAKLCY